MKVEFQICKCKITSPENELYISDETYVFATPEERPPLGVSSCIVHAKCSNPVSEKLFNILYHDIKNAPYLGTKEEFELR